MCPSNVRAHDYLVSVPSVTTLRYSRLYFQVESSANKIGETKEPGETPQPLAVEAEKPQPTALFLLLADMQALESDTVPGLSPCRDHIIHIVQSRDVPLDPKDVRVSSLNSMTITRAIAVQYIIHCIDNNKEKSLGTKLTFQIAQKSKT